MSREGTMSFAFDQTLLVEQKPQITKANCSDFAHAKTAPFRPRRATRRTTGRLPAGWPGGALWWPSGKEVGNLPDTDRRNTLEPFLDLERIWTDPARVRDDAFVEVLSMNRLHVSEKTRSVLRYVLVGGTPVFLALVFMGIWLAGWGA